MSYDVIFYFFNETPLAVAIENKCIDMVEYLLAHQNIDVNAKIICFLKFQYNSNFILFNGYEASNFLRKILNLLI